MDKLGWKVRIGFGAGDFAQNLVYPAAAMYLLFFYTDVLGIAPSAAAAIFLVAQIVDFVWNPFAGAFIDSRSPRLGRYRTWLLAAGLPLAVLAVMCFWNPFGELGGILKTVYAAVTYIAFSMSFTLVNVAYGALGASLSRDTDEITVLTATRIFLANAACLVVAAGVPILVGTFGGAPALPWRTAIFMGLGMLPSFLFLPLLPWLRRKLGTRGLFYAFAPVAVAGMAALYILSRMGGPGFGSSVWVHVAQFVKATGIIVATGYMWALVPEVIEHSERLTGRRLSAVISSIMGIFFRLGMAVGKILPGVVLAWTGYRAAAPEESASLSSDPRAWLATMGVFALVAAAALVFSFSQTKERIVANAADDSRVGIGEIWCEFCRNRPLRVLALFFVLAFAMMSVGNAAGAYFMNGLESQTPLAQEGVRWLVCVIPSIFISSAAFVISRYRV
jgi:Na+/melibiose symporter-like transporter